MADTILVTGGTGFIGSHTVVELQNAGYNVVIIDNLSNSSITVLENLKTITGKDLSFYPYDLTEKSKVLEIFNVHSDIKGVIHFAALKAVGESVSQPLSYYQNNLASLMNVIEAMKMFGVKNLVFSSSCTVYGQPDSLPVTENFPKKKAESPYGTTKSMCEDIVEDCAKAYNLKAINLRYFNPIGAHPSGLIGENPKGLPNNIMPVITQTAIGKRNQLTVFGNDYPTHDGTCIRDFIHITDLAKAHLIAIERLIFNQDIPNCEAFNLGTGNGFSVLELINAFERESGVKLNYIIGNRREGDVVEIYAETTKANTVLGWKAQEDIYSMVKSAWQWELHIHKQNMS